MSTAEVVARYADALEDATGYRPVAEDPSDAFRLGLGVCEVCSAESVTATLYDVDRERVLCWDCVRAVGVL